MQAFDSTIGKTEEERNIAICYLFHEGDEKNRCVLTTRKLMVVHRKVEQIFSHGVIKNIVIERKKLLLPLLAGGILIPLALLGMMNFNLDPLTGILLILAGSFLFFLGWNGSKVLTVYFDGQMISFPCRGTNSGVEKFAEYAWGIISGKPGRKVSFYIPLKKTGLEENGLNFMNSNKNGLNVYSYDEVSEKIRAGEFNGEDILYIFDPVYSRIRIRYIQGKAGKLDAFFPDVLDAGDFKEVISVADFLSPPQERLT